WRCLNCLGRPVLCIECCRETHRVNPFHRVEQWTGDYFASAWLWQVGIGLHLGHHG
ncbi:hypothetical protein JAAARDRAFT_86779, partial [Jaapia argillacea MUCL 33604]